MIGLTTRLMTGLNMGVTRGMTGLKYSSMTEHIVGGASDKTLLMIIRSDHFAMRLEL